MILRTYSKILSKIIFMPSVVSAFGNSIKSLEIILSTSSFLHEILSLVVKEGNNVASSSLILLFELARNSRNKANVIPPSLT